MQGGGCLCLCNGGSVHSESNLKTLSQHSWDTYSYDCAWWLQLGKRVGQARGGTDPQETLHHCGVTWALFLPWLCILMSDRSLFSLIKHTQTACWRWMRLMRAQVHHPYTQKKTWSWFYQAAEVTAWIIHLTTVQLYHDMDFKPKASDVLKGLNDKGNLGSLCKSQGAVSFRGQGSMCFWRKKIDAFWKCHILLLLFQAHWDTASTR